MNNDSKIPKIGWLTSFGKEISLALMVKFCLLFLLWWVFFSGKKLIVDNHVVARQLLGNCSVSANAAKLQEKLCDHQ
jgi:hypothetical protein